MPGPKSRSIYAARICLLATVAAVGGYGQGRSTNTPQLLGSAVMFVGWRADSAVMQKEENFENGQIKVSYFTLGSDSQMRPLPRSYRPADLPRGTVLVQDYTPAPNTPGIDFKLETDPREVKAVEDALEAWAARGDGQPQSFPQIHANFRILFGERDVWTKRQTLSVSGGEAGYEYKPPKLRFAALSPQKSALVVELTGSSGSRFVRIELPSK
jgi:hypothetical protein